MTKPPDELPAYRLLAGPDDAELFRRVSEALELGYRLYSSTSISISGDRVVAAQAALWPA